MTDGFEDSDFEEPEVLPAPRRTRKVLAIAAGGVAVVLIGGAVAVQIADALSAKPDGRSDVSRASPPPQAASAPTATNTAAAPSISPTPAAMTSTPVPYDISGTVSCVSGKSVEGVWVEAPPVSGFAPWQGIGNGSTSRYWYTLPNRMSFALHVGCGGATAAWAVELKTPQTPGPVADFTCFDDSTQPLSGTCVLQ